LRVHAFSENGRIYHGGQFNFFPAFFKF
jgi:hypothetical protein